MSRNDDEVGDWVDVLFDELKDTHEFYRKLSAQIYSNPTDSSVRLMTRRQFITALDKVLKGYEKDWRERGC